MFLPCSTCQAREKKQKLLLFLEKNGFCRKWWAVSFHADTGLHSAQRQNCCKPVPTAMSFHRKVSLEKCLSGCCVWERSWRAGSQTFSPTVTDCMWLQNLAGCWTELVQLSTTFHCYREGGDFLFIESFPLFRSSFLMINAPFIILTNSTLLWEILSLWFHSVSQVEKMCSQAERKPSHSKFLSQEHLPCNILQLFSQRACSRGTLNQFPPGPLWSTSSRKDICSSQQPLALLTLPLTWLTQHFPNYTNLLVFSLLRSSCASREIYHMDLLFLFQGHWLSLLSAK